MTAILSFKIRTIKHQIEATLKLIADGIKFYIEQLIVLEEKLEELQSRVKNKMKVQVKTGSEWHTTETRSAMVKVDGKPIYEALKPLEKPTWELVGNKGRHGKWCIAEYELPSGAKIEFKANANECKPIQFSFVVGEIQDVDVDGYVYNNDICGWIVSI